MTFNNLNKHLRSDGKQFNVLAGPAKFQCRAKIAAHGGNWNCLNQKSIGDYCAHHDPATVKKKRAARAKAQLWQCFCDESYYHKWAVQRRDKKSFEDAIHVLTQEEAQYLVDRLNELEALRKRLKTKGNKK